MKRTTLQTGMPAPPFRATDAVSGTEYALEELRGTPVVLYVYPKDATPGCTAQACAFRDVYAELREAGATLLGVSMDPAESRRRFAEAHALPFPLLLDPNGEIVDAYGAWQPWAFTRSGLMVRRMTVLVDAAGTIRRIWPKAHPTRNPAEVLAAVRDLATDTTTE